VRFDYEDEYLKRNEGIDDHAYVNVIAQEFREVFPDYVKGSDERLPDGGEILQVDTYPLTIYTAASVQELSALVEKQGRVMSDQSEEIANQRARITDLQTRIALLESLMRSAPR
jgi:hypothetical protein